MISNVDGALVTYQYGVKHKKTSAQETTFIEKVTDTEGAAGTQELSDAEKLENFKKEIWDEINSFSWNKSMNISIQITDGAFKRMMEDSDFKDRMLNVIQKESIAAQPPGNVSLTWIDESGYKGYSYLDNDAGAIAFKAHSNDKDAFYVKKATKGQDYTELWEERQLERERQREKLDKEYVDKLYLNRTLLRKEQVAATYDANVKTETVAGGDSLLG